ncbi:MAG: hypothetical protein ACRBDI_03275 [Alphaproteobacteria bacterium]
MQIDTSLLREKFVIRERNPSSASNAIKITALSNRMAITLKAGEMPGENYIIRSSNMHSCVRFAALLLAEFERLGPLLSRTIKINWHEMWDNSLSPFERLHNPDRWICLYSKGKIVFSEGKHHQFLDVIEQCDIVNKESYDKSIRLAESAFSQAGKDVAIEFDSNVALVCALSRIEGRCSMIIRGPGNTHTFNCNLKPDQGEKKINIVHGLSISADILEAVQLCYRVGENNVLLEMGKIKKFSDEYNLTIAAKKRIHEVNIQLSSMENIYAIRYRPERPNFDHIIDMTERYVHAHPPPDDDEAYV